MWLPKSLWCQESRGSPWRWGVGSGTEDSKWEGVCPRNKGPGDNWYWWSTSFPSAHMEMNWVPKVKIGPLTLYDPQTIGDCVGVIEPYVFFNSQRKKKYPILESHETGQESGTSSTLSLPCWFSLRLKLYHKNHRKERVKSIVFVDIDSWNNRSNIGSLSFCHD